MTRKKRFSHYTSVPEVRGTKDEFDLLTKAGWRIDSDFFWTRRFRKTDPPHFVLNSGVGSMSEQSVRPSAFNWYFRTAGAACRFEQGMLRGLGSFDVDRLTPWQSGSLHVWYAVVVDRVMGACSCTSSARASSPRVFNVVLIGGSGSRRFKIKPNTHEVTIYIDAQPAPEATADGPTRTDPHPSEDHKFLRGFIQGYREAVEFMTHQHDEERHVVPVDADGGSVPPEAPRRPPKALKHRIVKPKPKTSRKTRRK